MRSRLLFLCSLVILGVLAVAVPRSRAGSGEATAVPGGDRLLGAWRLVSVETIRPNGEVIYPFYGKHPEGLIVYDRSGWMSVQIVSDPKPPGPKGDSRETFRNGSPDEKVVAIEGYYAYFGTWTVDSSTSTVTHHLKDSLYPGERGVEFARHFTFNGDQLTLIAKTHEMGEDHQRKLVWQRAR
ncbi:MAG: lipocalin-like domain-containing protein [Acidobacteria bacterium]|nr:lipocalin-like domain-containing protein [Acidobacteriota bacterium]